MKSTNNVIRHSKTFGDCGIELNGELSSSFKSKR